MRRYNTAEDFARAWYELHMRTRHAAPRAIDTMAMMEARVTRAPVCDSPVSGWYDLLMVTERVARDILSHVGEYNFQMWCLMRGQGKTVPEVSRLMTVPRTTLYGQQQRVLALVDSTVENILQKRGLLRRR